MANKKEELKATPQQQKEAMDEIIHDGQRNGKCELCKNIMPMETAVQTAGESLGIEWSKTSNEAMIKYIKFQKTNTSSETKKKKVSECPKCGYELKVKYGKKKAKKEKDTGKEDKKNE